MAYKLVPQLPLVPAIAKSLTEFVKSFAVSLTHTASKFPLWKENSLLPSMQKDFRSETRSIFSERLKAGYRQLYSDMVKDLIYVGQEDRQLHYSDFKDGELDFIDEQIEANRNVPEIYAAWYALRQLVELQRKETEREGRELP